MSDLACCVCRRLTNRLAGDPGAWPVMFGHVGGEGQTFVHCGDCCAKMYQEYAIGRDLPQAFPLCYEINTAGNDHD